IGMLPSGGYTLDVDLFVEITGLSQENAEKLVAATHQVCPYSNATHGNIDVRLHTTAI
ncbi:OsmC-like protein, partial [Acinetobacter puyangensis]